MTQSMTRALRRFEKAAINFSWRGSEKKESIPEIEEEYRRARTTLIRKINALERYFENKVAERQIHS
jgi:hypothetical protein